MIGTTPVIHALGGGPARLLGAASWWRQRRHRPVSRLELLDVGRATDRARALLGDEAFQLAYRTGSDAPHTVVVDPDTVAAHR